MKEEALIDPRTLAEKLIDARTLAEKLGITVSAVRLWTRTTALPRIRLGRLVRFRYSDVIDFLERGGK